jgi:Protein of unknown function (DUF3987)
MFSFIFGGIQPGRLRAYMADALKDGPSNDGLMQRFQLLVCPDARPDYKLVDRPANVVAMKAADTVYRRIASMDAENPLRLRFTSDAQELFNTFLTDLETREKLMQIGHVDRRKTRYVRLRKAIANGLADPDELKVKCKPAVEPEAVDPALDEVVKRLMRRVRI